VGPKPHQILLPPAAPADLEAIARREARMAPGGLPAPPLADAVAMGALRDGRRQTGYAAVSAEELAARLQPLIEAGVRVDSATTPALAHASLVRQRRDVLPDAVVAVLSVNAQATAITVVCGNVVLFARELPWGGETDQQGRDQDSPARAAFASRIAAELRRSLVYVRQSQKADVGRVLVCGDLFDLRSLTGPLRTNWRWTLDVPGRRRRLDSRNCLSRPTASVRASVRGGPRWRLPLTRRSQPGLSSEHARPSGDLHSLVARGGGAAGRRASSWRRDGACSAISRQASACQEAHEAHHRRAEPELQRQDEDGTRGGGRVRARPRSRPASQGALAPREGPEVSAAPPDVAISSIRGSRAGVLASRGRPGPADVQRTRRSPVLSKPRKRRRCLAARPRRHAPRATSDPAEAIEQADRSAVEDAVRPAQPAPPLGPPRGPSTSKSRVTAGSTASLRRNTGNLEGRRERKRPERLQGRAARSGGGRRPSGAAAPGATGRHPASARVHAAIRGGQVKPRTGGLAEALERLLPFLTIVAVVTAGWFWFVQPRLGSYLRARTDAAALEERVRTLQQAAGRRLAATSKSRSASWARMPLRTKSPTSRRQRRPP
jgi:hypothetical protein